MLLRDYIKTQIHTEKVTFEYGYFGLGGSFMKDEKLSCQGTVAEVAAFIDLQEALQFIYACSGEANDFEMEQSADETVLRFIDFR